MKNGFSERWSFTGSWSRPFTPNRSWNFSLNRVRNIICPTPSSPFWQANLKVAGGWTGVGGSSFGSLGFKGAGRWCPEFRSPNLKTERPLRPGEDFSLRAWRDEGSAKAVVCASCAEPRRCGRVQPRWAYQAVSKVMISIGRSSFAGDRDHDLG